MNAFQCAVLGPPPGIAREAFPRSLGPEIAFQHPPGGPGPVLLSMLWPRERFITQPGAEADISVGLSPAWLRWAPLAQSPPPIGAES